MNIVQKLQLLEPTNVLSVPGLVAVWDASDPRNGGVGLADGDGITILENLANPRPAFFDPFTRADSALELGNGWVAQTGVLGISSNKAYVVSLTSSTARAVRETGLADLVLAGDVTWETGAEIGFLFRVTDSTNFLYCRMISTNTKIFKFVDGVATELGSYTLSPSNGTVYHHRFILNGSSVILQLDDGGTLTTRISITETFNQTATQHGLYAQTSTAGKWDNVVIAKLTDAIQTTAAAQLTYKTSIQNGRSVARGDGTAKYMEIPHSSVFDFGTGAWTIVVVAKANALANGKPIISKGTAGVGDPQWYMRLNDANNPAAIQLIEFDGTNSTTLDASGQVSADVTNIFTGVFDTTSALSRNGGTVVTSTSTLRNANNTQPTLLLKFSTDFGNFDVMEVRLYNVGLPQTHQRRVLRYLSRKWGIALTA